MFIFCETWILFTLLHVSYTYTLLQSEHNLPNGNNTLRWQQTPPSRITVDTELTAVIAAAGESRQRSLSSDPASTLYISD